MGSSCSNLIRENSSSVYDSGFRRSAANPKGKLEDCNCEDEEDSFSTIVPIVQQHTFLSDLNGKKEFFLKNNEEKKQKDHPRNIYSLNSIEISENSNLFQPQSPRKNQTAYKRLLSLQEIAPGVLYEGDTVNGKRHGLGCQKWKNGTVYEGEFYNDKAKGKGKLTHKEGDYYEGEWDEDKANGFGIYVGINGAKYEGEWKDDKQHGVGVEVWPDGSKYEGEFLEGKKTGKGMLFTL